MSVTTTENRAYYNTLSVLADYELHHSKLRGDTSVAAPNAHPAGVRGVRNPDDWPTDHRRIPAYRPVNHELDQSQRRIYQNPAEMVFINVMFTGVRTNATLSRLWHATGGKLWDIRYKIGGEW